MFPTCWMVATRESAALAERLIAETCEKQEIVTGTLTVHADRGSSMTSKTVALLLADLGVTKSHSRPHVRNRELRQPRTRADGEARHADIDALSHTITRLEQQAADLRIQLEERDSELAAARAANRELMTQLNAARHQ